MRVRFTIAHEKWAAAEQYAKDTNRSTSELICEAIDQLMARYPKRRHATETDLDVLTDKVAKKLRLRYPQVPPGSKGPGLLGVDWNRIGGRPS